MDPLTHTLVGAGLAATRLGQKTPLAIPALIIGANLPDVDVLAYFRGDDFALGFRRGWTHGVLALVILPALLAGILLIWDRLRGETPRGSRLSPGWLLVLSYLACLTHPFLDWLNNYGMRWWMPFKGTWYYGDSVFIMDPWLWLLLGLGWTLGRRPSRGSATVSLIMVSLVILLVASAATSYLPIVGTVFLILLVSYLWNPSSIRFSAHRAALAGLVFAGLYIGALITLHSLTLKRAQLQLHEQGMEVTKQLMVGPTPANPLIWDVVADFGETYRWGRFDWRGEGTLVMTEGALPAARSSPLWPAIITSGQSPGFLRWVRFPWLEVEATDSGDRIHLMDARYTRWRSTGFGATTIELHSR